MSFTVTCSAANSNLLLVKNRTTTLSAAINPANTDIAAYRWYENGNIISGATDATYTPLPLTENKTYRVDAVSSTAPTVFVLSESVTLSVVHPPEIVIEPSLAPDSVYYVGDSVTLSVTPKPNNYNSYQWYYGASGITDSPIAEATGSTLNVLGVSESYSAWVQISNIAGVVNSNSVRVTVRERVEPSMSHIVGGSRLDFGGVFDQGFLEGFPVSAIEGVAQAQSLAACAQNLPNRLKDMAVNLAMREVEKLLNKSSGTTFQDLQWLLAKYNQALIVIERIKEIAVMARNPRLIDAIMVLRTLTGIDLIEQTNKVIRDFGAVSGIADIVQSALSSDFCSIGNYDITGKPIRATTNIPMGVPPSPVGGIPQPVGLSEYNSKPKDDYDSFMFQLKGYLNSDQSKIQGVDGGVDAASSSAYLSSVTYRHNIAMAYHDKLKGSTDNSRDAEFREAYNKAVSDTLQKNSAWPKVVSDDFKNNCDVIGEIISRHADFIRAYFSPSTGGGGGWIPHYMTAYGHVTGDDGKPLDGTTLDDINAGTIKPEWQRMGNRNNILVKGTSVASNGWKHGTVLGIRFADTKEPVGSGQVRVDDIGGMSKNVIDYFCGGDRELYKTITSRSKNNRGISSPAWSTPIEVRLISGGPRNA